MASDGERFFLDQDQSSHWYIIPVGHRAEWDAWRDIPEDDERSWEVPEFAIMVDGPGRLTFADYREE